jgi:hypothetical protein
MATKKTPNKIIEEALKPKIKATVKATVPNDTVKVVLMTAQKDYEFVGTDLQVLFKLLPDKISGKTSISITKNGLTHTKMIKPMLLKKYLNNAKFLKILEKQITSLLK